MLMWTSCGLDSLYYEGELTRSQLACVVFFIYHHFQAFLSMKPVKVLKSSHLSMMNKSAH